MKYYQSHPIRVREECDGPRAFFFWGRKHLTLARGPAAAGNHPEALIFTPWISSPSTPKTFPLTEIRQPNFSSKRRLCSGFLGFGTGVDLSKHSQNLHKFFILKKIVGFVVSRGARRWDGASAATKVWTRCSWSPHCGGEIRSRFSFSMLGGKCSLSCGKNTDCEGSCTAQKNEYRDIKCNEKEKNENCRIDMQRKGAKSTGRSLCGVGAIAEESNQFGDPSHHEIK